MFTKMFSNGGTSVWEDSMEVASFGATSVRIRQLPESVNPASEVGVYEITLQKGLWPDDIELALMVLGYAPESDEAKAYLASIDNNIGNVITVMPGFGVAMPRSVTVHLGARFRDDEGEEEVRVSPTAAVVVEKPKPKNKMKKKEWMLRIDMLFTKLQVDLASDNADIAGFLVTQYEAGAEPEQSAHAAISEFARINQTATIGRDA